MKTTSRTILVALKKTNLAIPICEKLRQSNFDALFCDSARQAQQIAKEELPHLVFCDSDLNDGRACDLYDAMQSNEHTKAIPFAINLSNRKTGQIRQLEGRQYCSVSIGPVTPLAISDLINDIFAQKSNLSPFYTPIEHFDLDENLIIEASASMVGYSEDQVVAISNTELAPEKKITCVPHSQNFLPVELKSSINIRHQNHVYNFFPISKIRGYGLKWIAKLPRFDLPHDQIHKIKKHLIYFNPKKDTAKQMIEILSGFDIEVSYVESLKQAAQMLQSKGINQTTFFLSHLPEDYDGLNWHQMYYQLPLNLRPRTIVLTNDKLVTPFDSLIPITKPTGFGHLLEALEASYENSTTLESRGIAFQKGLSVNFEIPARFIGFDERGGKLEIPAPLKRGTQFTIRHESLNQTLQSENKITISEIEFDTKENIRWLAKFEFEKARINKFELWDKINQFNNQNKAS